jgi:ferredoxin, 2Fe-2S
MTGAAKQVFPDGGILPAQSIVGTGTALPLRGAVGHGTSRPVRQAIGEFEPMGNLKVTFTDVNGVVRALDDVDAGLSLMEVAKAHDVAGIMGDCGGGCACATCHVYVASQWFEKVGEPDDIEFAMLDMVSDVQQDNSRLSCQIKMSEDLDGIEVTVAPTSSY